MKTSIIMLTLILGLPVPLFAQNLWQPGGPFNPYIISPAGPGQAKITTKYPDLSQPLLAPGQPYNPYVIRTGPGGQTTLQTDLPGDLGESGGDD